MQVRLEAGKRRLFPSQPDEDTIINHQPSLSISDSDTPEERRGASWTSASAMAASSDMLKVEARYWA